MLCSCLYCCIPSQGMGVEDAVFSVVGKWRPAILESFHGYTSSGFCSKLAKHPEGMTRWSVVWEWDCCVWCFACVTEMKLFRWPCLWLYLAFLCLTVQIQQPSLDMGIWFVVFFKHFVNLWEEESEFLLCGTIMAQGFWSSLRFWRIFSDGNKVLFFTV